MRTLLPLPSLLSLLLLGCPGKDADTGTAPDTADTGDTGETGDTDTGTGPDVEPARAFGDCSPNDAPAVAFQVGVDEATCDAALSGSSLVLVLWYVTWEDLEEGSWNISTHTGWAAWSDAPTSSELVQARTAVLNFERLEADGFRATYAAELTDGTLLQGTVEGPWCGANAICG